MLRQRVITALILVLLTAAAIVYLPSLPFTVFISILTLLAAWEWTALAGLEKHTTRLVSLLLAGALFMLLYPWAGIWLSWLTGLALLWWCLMLWLVCRYPRFAANWQRPLLLLPAGFCILFPLWFTILHLRDGENFIFHIFLLIGLVAAADIGAYFSGRKYGRHKLAAAVSPNKTWEGVFGGLLAVILLGLPAWILFMPEEPQASGYLLLTGLLVLLAACSVIGDLTESMIKRSRNVKDSGRLLPGHGGVLDRIDGLTAAAPVYLLMLQLLLPGNQAG